MQEDSFQLDLRRKTKWVDTNYILSTEDKEKYDRYCPIDHKYVASDGRCSGYYRNGSFKFYPPFSYQGCQCDVLIKEQEEAEDYDGAYSPPESFVTDEEQEIVIKNSGSPCTYWLKNETRDNAQKPNLWSQMNTIRINIKVDELPPKGEVYLFSSFAPDFWMNQPKTEKIVITEAGFE